MTAEKAKKYWELESFQCYDDDCGGFTESWTCPNCGARNERRVYVTGHNGAMSEVLDYCECK